MKVKKLFVTLLTAVFFALMAPRGSASDEVELNVANVAMVCRTPSGGYSGRFWPGSVEVGSLLRGDGDFDWCRGLFQWNLAAASITGIDEATFSVFVKQAPTGPGVWQAVLTDVYTDLQTVGWSQLFNASETSDLTPAPGAAGFTSEEVETFVFDGDGIVVINNILNKSDPSAKYLMVRIEAVEGQTTDGAVTVFGDGDGPGSRNDPQPLLRLWRDAPPPPPPPPSPTATSCALEGDENGDRIVDIFDIMAAASRWRNGYTVADIQRVAANWGASCG